MKSYYDSIDNSVGRALKAAMNYRCEMDRSRLRPAAGASAIGIQAFEIPRHDALNLPGMSGIAMRIRYDSPAGWTTYSPEIAIDFARNPVVKWRR
jgi:hypothetical protein